METILLKILEVQNEILAEVRMLRQAVTHGVPLAAAAPPPLSRATAQAAPSPLPEPEPWTHGPSATGTRPTPPPGYELAPPPEPPLAAAPAPQPLAPPPQQPGGRLTVNELADIGGQFLDPGQMPRGKVKSVDASALSHSILDDIKAKNKAKSSAFAEFEKFGRNR
jgi:hypothetical protein